MDLPFEKSRSLQEKAHKYVPLGVNSNFRYWGEGLTPYVSRAKGGILWDVDGNRYIDYRLAFGPIILGHAYDEVDSFVHAEIDRGILFAMTSELEIELAKMIVDMCPAVEMVRLACSGTEATMHALRVARAFTGRDRILKFEGMYHGFHDHTLFSTYAPADAYGNINSPIPVASSSGIPRPLHDMVTTLPFNNYDLFEKAMRRVGHELAAVIIEPAMGNCAAIMPEAGFLQFVQAKCREYGVVFILDEVKTGFRIANGGAQEVYGLDPDMATYAKALGNGYPIAAFGGKKEIMSIIGQGVAQGGTFNNNKPGVAGAYATLKLLKEQPILETIRKRGARLMHSLEKIFMDASIPVIMAGFPAMFSFAIGAEKVNDQRSWQKTDRDYYLTLIEAATKRGIMPDHDPREPWFMCYSHSDQDIDETLNVMQDVVKIIPWRPS